MQKIEEKLGRFPFTNVMHTPVKHEMKAEQTQRHSFEEERKQTRSEKFLPSNFS